MPQALLEFLLILSVPMGGGHDLLSFVPTDAYWKVQKIEPTPEALLNQLRPGTVSADVGQLIKDLGADEFETREMATQKLQSLGPAVTAAVQAATKSDDVETATRAKRILEALDQGESSQDVRRLMAVRALGELKHREALETLGTLAKGENRPLADYARRSIAAIEGQPFARPRPTAAELEADLLLLPQSCGVVAQVSVTQPVKFDLPGALKGKGPLGGEADADVLHRRVQTRILKLLSQVGNVRLDSLTLGFSADAGPAEGFVVFIARGEYDVVAWQRMLIDAKTPQEKIGNIPVFTRGERMRLLFVSPQRLILIAGPSSEKLPLKELVANVATNKGQLLENKRLADLIKSVDRTKPLWGAAIVPEWMRKEAAFAGVETALAEIDERDGGLTGRVRAQGADADALEKSRAAFADGLSMAIKQGKEGAVAIPMLQPVVEFLESVALTRQDKTVIATGVLKDPTPLLAAPLLISLSFSRGDDF